MMSFLKQTDCATKRLSVFVCLPICVGNAFDKPEPIQTVVQLQVESAKATKFQLLRRC